MTRLGASIAGIAPKQRSEQHLRTRCSKGWSTSVEVLYAQQTDCDGIGLRASRPIGIGTDGAPELDHPDAQSRPLDVQDAHPGRSHAGAGPAEDGGCL